MKKPIWRMATIVGVVAAVAVMATTGASAHSTKPSTIKSGGTLNVGWEQSFGFTDNMDPTGEYLGDAFGILDNLLVRTLVGYNHAAGAAGNQIVPDIASSVPKPTNGGKTYTFHLKSGIKFSPPVNRAVTSQDFVTSMDRLASKKDGSEYSFYYTVIKGFSAYADGKAKTISGISTPNASTIVFNLTQPTGDFLYRMSMPATGPMPAEVTKCFENDPGAYADDLISTAGYMIKGIDSVDISSCSKLVDSKGKPLQPASGYQPTSLLDLVRNPNYSQATDPTRKNYVDEVRFIIDSSDVDIYNKIEAGQLDMATSSIPPDVLKKYVTTPSLKSHFFQNQGDRTWYITMNLTAPPFDDIHVRRAMNWIIDKAALRQTWGGPTVGTIANHIVPDTLFNFKLQEYAPYKTAGRSRQHREGDGRDEGLEVLERERRHVRRSRLQERPADLRHPRRRPGHGRDDRAGREEDRDHLQGAPDQRCVPDDPDGREEHPDRRAPGLGQGLRRPGDVLQPAVRRPDDHPDR